MKDKPVNIVLVGGCFDLLHYGHISFLKQAKKLGNYLLVLLESDKSVKRLKGEGRPFHNEQQRKEMLESLSFVDEVRIIPPISGNEAYNIIIDAINPSVIAFTEGDPIKNLKINQAKSIGARAIEISKVHTPSTSQLAKLIGLE